MQSRLRDMTMWFDRYFGWFFTNGNKVHLERSEQFFDGGYQDSIF